MPRPATINKKMPIPNRIQKITIVGAGNVGWHLARAFYQKGYIIKDIWSRNFASATELASKVNSRAVRTLSDLSRDTDLFVVSVTDSAIPWVVENLDSGDKMVVHTAGSVGMDVLQPVSSHIGVFYPLQTFSRHIPLNLSEVPFCIEANGEEEITLLGKLASTLSNVVKPASSEQRLLLHVAAVFASNYSNLMYILSNEILKPAGLNFEYLKPLVAETARKVQTNDPARVQTGPAKRGDHPVLDKHIEILSEMPEHQDIYRKLALMIQERFKE